MNTNIYDKILNTLLASSLGSMISDHEIEEIALELEEDIDFLINDKIEQIKEDAVESSQVEIRKLKGEISKLESSTITQKEFYPDIKSLDDMMTMEWVKENWEHIVKMQKLNIEGKMLLGAFIEALKNLHSMDMMCKEGEKLLAETKKLLKNHKRIVLVGKGASGKDYARNLFAKKNFQCSISYTTRPPRETEKDGIDYFFVTEEKFKQMIENDEFYEYVAFNGWYYGTSKKQFYSDSIFIMTPSGISKIIPEDRENSIIIYFDISDDKRKERLSLRSDADKVNRRLAADAMDFQNFTDYDLRISNSDF